MSQPTAAEKFAAMSVREKSMVLAAGVVVVLMLGLTFLLEPALKAITSAEQALQIEQERNKSLVQQQAAFRQALNEDPDLELKRQLEILTRQYEQLQKTFATELGELVLPQQMPGLIEGVFSRASGLELIEMRSLTPKNIFADKPDMEGVAVYQHGLSLTFRGRYFDVRDFLASLEKLTSQLYWRSMAYNVEEYPDARVTIEVYTLSTEKAFIGVE